MAYRYKPELPNVEYNDFGFPQIYCAPNSCDFESLIWLRFGSGGQCDARHCFVDDWRLEHLWRRQGQGLAKAIMNGVMTAPDFTIEKTFPQPYAHYQVWRSAAIARYWQDEGVTVVPVLQWGNPDQYYLPLLTVKIGSVVAVRGPQRGTEEEWLQAAVKIQQLLEPSIVLHFGRKVDVWKNPIYVKLNAKI